MFQPERHLIKKQQRDAFERYPNPSLELNKAHRVAETFLKEHAIDVASFKGFYDAEKLAHHHKRLLEREKTFILNPDQEEQKKVSDLLEATLVDRCELDNWFGQNTSVRKTCAYDDVFNGIDMVLEQERVNASTYIGLTVDVCFSVQETRKKVDDILSGIERQELSRVDYYESPRMKGEIKNIPRIVLGVERERALEIGEMWYRIQTGKAPKDSLVKSPVRTILIHEMLLQLEAFEKFATGARNPFAAKAYREGLSVVQSALQAAKADGISMQIPTTDRVHKAILESVDGLR